MLKNVYFPSQIVHKEAWKSLVGLQNSLSINLGKKDYSQHFLLSELLL